MFIRTFRQCHYSLLNVQKMQKFTFSLPCTTSTTLCTHVAYVGNRSYTHQASNIVNRCTGVTPYTKQQRKQLVGSTNLNRILWSHSIHSGHNLALGSKSDKQLSELKEKFKDDPDVTQWLKDLSEDFGEEKQTDAMSSSHDRSSSESDSSSDLDSDMELDSEHDVTSRKSHAVDVDKEMLKYNIEEFYGIEEDEDFVDDRNDIPLPISTERGYDGVFDVEEMVEVLKSENGTDICVIRVPEELDYVDYLVLVTGRSLRHIKAMAFFIKWMYKKKRSKDDAPSCRIEGLNSNDWLAVDLKNMVVHLMLAPTRELYDIETLWTVGPEYDDKMKEEEDPFATMFGEEDFLTTSNKSVKSVDNLLTLSQKAKYIYDTEEQTQVDYKFTQKPKHTMDGMDMENVAGWHSYDENKDSSTKG